MNDTQPSGNYFDKYNSRNILHKKLMKGYFMALESLLERIDFDSVLDAGCGEGHICNYLYQTTAAEGRDRLIAGTDISKEVIALAKENNPSVRFNVSPIEQMDEEDCSFDLVIATEVLEHLKDPNAALEEIFRISGDYVILSVPREPIWRIANFARGKYLRQWGNTPGHIQHWNKKQFVETVRVYGDIVDIRAPFPWIMVLLKKRSK